MTYLTINEYWVLNIYVPYLFLFTRNFMLRGMLKSSSEAKRRHRPCILSCLNPATINLYNQYPWRWPGGVRIEYYHARACAIGVGVWPIKKYYRIRQVNRVTDGTEYNKYKQDRHIYSSTTAVMGDSGSGSGNNCSRWWLMSVVYYWL